MVSARKYRPSTFDTVVGQQHVTTTLKNAIANNHLAHAFLFCGPRGVGKTTCARILAKTINCQNLREDIEPCNECSSCRSFNEGASLSIFELDAASNNSVEDIRELIEQVRFAPQSGQYKVYVIDEVHMLSQNAFNAFLKTLEEPPAHAKFILATTEKHKILPTILSRCQVFDFNRIQQRDIASHLASVAEKESIIAETDALNLIAQKAEGGMRDALSLFDLMATFGGGKSITYQNVIANLHILDYDYYFKMVDAFNGQDLKTALLLFDEILKKGFDGHNFIVGLGEHLRNLMIVRDVETAKLLELGASVQDRYVEQSKNTPISLIVNGLTLCNETDQSYRAAKNQRLTVEIALMRLCHLRSLVQVTAETASEKKK